MILDMNFTDTTSALLNLKKNYLKKKRALNIEQSILSVFQKKQKSNIKINMNDKPSKKVQDDAQRLLAALMQAIINKEGETYLKNILSDTNKILNKKP
jgi:uncharacterized Fe-S center protein